MGSRPPQSFVPAQLLKNPPRQTARLKAKPQVSSKFISFQEFFNCNCSKYNPPNIYIYIFLYLAATIGKINIFLQVVSSVILENSLPF